MKHTDASHAGEHHGRFEVVVGAGAANETNDEDRHPAQSHGPNREPPGAANAGTVSASKVGLALVTKRAGRY